MQRKEKQQEENLEQAIEQSLEQTAEPTEQEQEQDADAALLADAAKAPTITPEEFYEKRAAIISTYSNNAEIVDGTLNALIVNLLGFTENLAQKWKPVSRYTLELADGVQDTVTLYVAPCGLFSVSATVYSDKLNDDLEHETLVVPEHNFEFPAVGLAKTVNVFDSAHSAILYIFTELCNATHNRLGFGSQFFDWISDIFNGSVFPEPILLNEQVPAAEEGPAPETLGAEQPNDHEAATAESPYKPGEQMELAPDIFPSLSVWQSPGKKKVIEQINSVNAALKANEEDLKEIKEEQKSSYAQEINVKKQHIEMFERLSHHYEILECIEQARYESAVGDCIFSVFTTPDTKGKWCKVGTGQDVLEARLKYGHAYVFIVAEFIKGEVLIEDANNEDEESASLLMDGAKDEKEEDISVIETEGLYACERMDIHALGKSVEEARECLMCGQDAKMCDGCDGPKLIENELPEQSADIDDSSDTPDVPEIIDTAQDGDNTAHDTDENEAGAA